MKFIDIITPDVQMLINEIDELREFIDYKFKNESLIIRFNYADVGDKIVKILDNVEDFCNISSIRYTRKDDKIRISSINY